MSVDPLRLIKEIHRQARLQGMAPPAATRLVKLVYLADLEWRRQNGGDPLGQLSWRFLHFGPYAAELADLLGGPDVEINEFAGGKAAHRLVFAPEDLVVPQVPEDVSRLVGRVVREWGDADLNLLLDYVYFETEPMEMAKRGELLDFSRLRASERTPPPRVDQTKLAVLRERIRERVKQLNLARNGLVLPLDAQEAAQAWDEDDRPLRLPVGFPVKLRT